LNPIDRRCEPRMPFAAVVRLIAWGSNDVMAARISDLSLHGCFVSTLTPRSPGEKVWITIAFAGLKVGAVGKVAHVCAEGMGITFSKIQMSDQSRVELWINFLRAELEAQR